MCRAESIIAVLIIIFLFSGMGIMTAVMPFHNDSKDYGSKIIYQQESVSSINGRAYSDPSKIPYHQSTMVTFGLGNATSQAVSWDVGDFTGLHVPEPKENYQRGINGNADGYGWTAVQMYKNYAGVLINTWSASHDGDSIANGQMSYWWMESDDVRPWTSTTSILKLSYYLMIPHGVNTSTGGHVGGVYLVGGAVAYSSTLLLLKDTVTGKEVWIVVNAYDSRGDDFFDNGEFIMYDTGYHPTYIPMIESYYGSGTRFVYRGSNSSYSTGNMWDSWKYFEYRMNYDNFSYAIGQLNEQYEQNYSTDPMNYILLDITVQAEISWPQGGNGTIGISFYNVQLEELNSAIPEFSWM